MLSRLRILAIFIGLCLSCNGCLTPVVIKNFDATEYYEVEKDGEAYHCMSSYYIE